MFLSFFSFSTQAACPDYDIELEYISGPSSCGYSLYRVKVNSSSSLNVGGINLTLNFTKGGVNSVFFDDASVFSEVSGVSATIGANSIQFQGIPSSSINYDVIGSIGKLAICGRLPGGTTVNLTGQVRNVFSEQCDPQNVILPTINFSDVVEYGGIVQKEPKNCLNSNNGIELVSVSMHEYLNEDQPTVIGTNIQGYYTLNSGTPFVSLKGQCYEICPTKGSVSSCSINANDLARTQGVVLGSYCTTDAWEKLAMDVNNDNYVSTNDLLIMQSIILGTFDFNTSFWKYWKFVEGLAYASMTVNCTAAVPAYSECISVTSNNSTESNGWIGVISGDADGSCTTCSFEGGNDTRDSRQSQINIEETEDNVIFKIYSSEENDPMGQGGEFKFDESQLRNLKVVQGENEKNESLKYVLENDVFKFHWLNLGSTERDHAKPLITIVADKLTDDLDFASIFAQEESTLNVAHFNNEALPLQYVMNSKFMTMDQSSILISDNGVFLEICQGPKVELSLFTINGKLATSDNNVICGQWWKPDVAPGFYLGKAEDGKNCIAFKILVR